jgi:FlaA1/EpsC-like NDP-sugar epimerase
MTRFVMTVEEAVGLVLGSVGIARGGEVFVSKMPVMRIRDLARVMIDTLGPRFGHDPAKLEIKLIGKKAGEKLFEELMTQEETSRAWELKETYAVLPAFRSVYQDISYDYPNIVSKSVTTPYVSDIRNSMTYDQLRGYIEDRGVIQKLELGEA